MRCPKCNYLNLAAEGYCEQCGAPLQATSKPGASGNNRGRLRSEIPLLGGTNTNKKKSESALPLVGSKLPPQERSRRAHNENLKQQERQEQSGYKKNTGKPSLKSRLIGFAVGCLALLVITSFILGWPFPWN